MLVAEELLKRYKQEHIIKFLENNPKLEEQILSFDFDTIINLYNSVKNRKNLEASIIEHMPYTNKEKLSEKETKELEDIGEKIIKQNKYAVITMAGGQGTRLGHTGPKGTYKINTVNGPKYLFEIIIDELKKAQEKYGTTIMWYIMTSKENNDETENFLKIHNFFGYPSDKVKFFKQGEMPLISDDGKLLINEHKIIKEASDGNGSIYASLDRDGILEDMRKREIEWIFIGGVDNVLLKFIDPLLTGLTIEEGNIIASKSIIKRDAYEKVGVFCKVNGRPKVIEYTEIPKDLAEEVDENGDFVYGDTNIISHLFNIKALEKIANKNMPYHVAHKKAEYLDESGNLIKPDTPNAYKFESFIFDAFEEFEDMTLLRVKRENEFAPIKNKEGNDSPETATKLYNNFMKRNLI